MSSPPFRVEPLGEKHERGDFDCGEEALNSYLRSQATQDVRRRVANCFVAVENASGKLAVYYTLSAASLALTDLPAEITKCLPRYPAIPAIRIGRLAVDLRFQGRGLGAGMLADATARAMRADVAAFMIVVDAKNESAVAFCRRYGFRLVNALPRTLFLPMETARRSSKPDGASGRWNLRVHG